MKVKRVRVIRNALLTGALCALVIWFDRLTLKANADALIWGTVSGTAWGLFHWHRLARRITRTGRRFARNRVFVQFLSPVDLLLHAAANHYLLIAILAAVLLGVIYDWMSGHWWSLLIGSFGVSASLVLALRIMLYERRHGPVYYQYDSQAWGGAEGLLYQTGQVVQPLTPAGKVLLNGELWNARSLSGEHIGKGERIEVVALDGLTLEVDRVAADVME